MLTCMCAMHMISLKTDIRHLSSLLSLQMLAGRTRLYCFMEMSAHSVCLVCFCVCVTDRDGGGKLNNISIRHRSQLDHLWETARQKPKPCIFYVWLYAWRLSLCMSSAGVCVFACESACVCICVWKCCSACQHSVLFFYYSSLYLTSVLVSVRLAVAA